MARSSDNSYHRSYSSTGIKGHWSDRKVEKEHLSADEVLDELGVPVNSVTSLLSGQVDVLRKKVVDLSTEEYGTLYDVEVPVGELKLERTGSDSEELNIQYTVDTPVGKIGYEIEN